MSVRQGELISALLDARGLPWNVAFEGRSVVVDDPGPRPAVELPGGMRVTVLAPDRRRLERLAKHYLRAAEEAGMVPGDVSSNRSTLDRDDARDGPSADWEDSDGAEADGDEVKPTRADPRGSAPDVAMLAAARVRPDRSVANGSSIALLLEFGGSAVLLGGDAYAQDLERGIRDLLRSKPADRLAVDAFVLPHNGSRGNVSSDLLRLLDCSNYLVSTNGSRFRHPDPEAIAMVLEHGRRTPSDPLTLIFNYRSPETELWSSPSLQMEHNYRAVFPSSADGGIRVELIDERAGPAAS